MKRYRLKATEATAVQYAGGDAGKTAVEHFVGLKLHYGDNGFGIALETFDGPRTMQPGDYLVRNFFGALQVWPRERFEENYAPVDPTDPREAIASIAAATQEQADLIANRARGEGHWQVRWERMGLLARGQVRHGDGIMQSCRHLTLGTAAARLIGAIRTNGPIIIHAFELDVAAPGKVETVS